MIKFFLKLILPISVRLKLRALQFKIFGFEKDYLNLDNTQIFNKIYTEGTWGLSKSGNATSGVGSHEKKVVQPYIERVSHLLDELRSDVIVDLGCGDFNIGKNFSGYANEYIACDVSTVILERNKLTFSELPNVTFKHLNLANDDLPNGDVCFVRQVLQHLSNSDIMEFVHYLNNNKPYKHLIVSEHLPLEVGFKENLDKPSGAQSRLIFGSGVVLHKPPFDLSYLSKYDLVDVTSGGGKIKTIVYNF